MKTVSNSSVVLIVLLAILLGSFGIVVVRRGWLSDSVGAQQKGPVKQLDSNADLQQAINRARPGDTIILQAGAVYKGPITLPVKPGTEFITIQSSRVSELPEGTRVSPSQSALFAKIQSVERGSPIVKTQPGAHHYKFVGIEFSTADPKAPMNDLIRFGENETQTTLDSVPHHLVIDRSYVHGLPTQDVQRGIAVNSAYTEIQNSYVSDVHYRGIESQGICGWNGPGPFTIINNYVEASGINIMFGGAMATIPGLIPTGITVKRNYLFKPLSWYVKDPSYAGLHWSVKNLFELKNARNAVIEENVFENNWTDAQAGWAIQFTPRPSDSGLAAVVEDVVFQNNIIRNSGAGVNILGADEPPAPTETRLRRLKIVNNLFENINGPRFSSSGAFLTITNGTDSVTIAHNTAIHTGNIISSDYRPNTNFIYRDNISRHNDYGIFGSGQGIGKPSIAHYFPGAIITGNVIVKEVNTPSNVESLYPAGNFFPQSMQAVGFVDYEGGNYRLRAGSRFHASATDGSDPGTNLDKLPKIDLNKR